MNTQPSQGPACGGVVYLRDLPYAARHWFNVVTLQAGLHPTDFEVSVTKADPALRRTNVMFLVRVTYLKNGAATVYEALECVGWVREFRLDLAAGKFGIIQSAPAPDLRAH